MKNLFAKLNGWQRLGIVLSVVWIVVGFLHLRNLQIERGLSFANMIFDACIRADIVANCSISTKSEYIEAYRINWEEVLVLIVLPVPLAWLACYLFKKIVLWVKDGFN